MARRISIALAVFLVCGVTAAVLADPVHKPSATCTDYDLEEARITEQLAQEPDRLWWKVEGQYLELFKWNMRWAFDIEVDADTLYIIEAMTPGSNIKHVHLFTVRAGCITHYSLTWGAVVAEMLRWDAWERGNPHVDGQTDRPVPPNRPLKPADPMPNLPTGTPPGLPPAA